MEYLRVGGLLNGEKRGGVGQGRVPQDGLGEG